MLRCGQCHCSGDRSLEQKEGAGCRMYKTRDFPYLKTRLNSLYLRLTDKVSGEGVFVRHLREMSIITA